METPFDRGIVVLNGNFDTVPINRFLCAPVDGDHVARATGHQLRVQHDFDSDWSLLVGASLRDTLLTGFSSDAEAGRLAPEGLSRRLLALAPASLAGL